VTEDTAPPPKSPSLSRRLRETVAAYPDAVAIALYALVAIAATAGAYFAIFDRFSPYDDEGTVLVTLKAFVNGGTLYRDIYSEYGPFYYELFGGLFALSGHAVSTDAGRSIVIVVWVSASLLFGIGAQRLTGRLSLGLVGMIAAYSSLYVLVNEPMHPHGLSVLMIAALALIAAWEPSRRVGWAGGAWGALAAALLLTKVNLGAFAIAAVAVAAVCTVGPLYRRRWLRFAVIAAFLAMPLLLASRDLSLAWVRELVVLEILAALAIVIAATCSLRPKGSDDDARLVRWLLAAMVGFALAFVAILAIIVLTGPSLADVYEGVITEAARVRDILVLQFKFPPAALDWGIAAVAAAVVTARLRSAAGHRPTIWSGLLRGAAGLTILFAVSRIVPFGLNPSAENPEVVPMVLAWIAVFPPAGARESPYKRFLRVLLPALAVAETLQVYPVAGSQTGIAAVAFVPVGALCLADALTELQAWGAAQAGGALECLRLLTGVAAVSLVGMFALDAVVLPGATDAVAYHDQQKLALPGAGLLHLMPPEIEIYTGLVDLLHRNGCTTFIGYPGINSLYLWSGLPGPGAQAPNAWMKALGSSQQRQIVEELRASPRPCAIRSEERASLYLQGLPPPDLPLTHYVFNDFTPAGEIGGYQFLLPKRSATAP
jgi:hypothetical protein